MVELNYSKKQLKPLIEKFNIDVENDSNFHDIIMMFDGQTNYHMWAIKLFYGKVCGLDVIHRIKDWSETFKTEIKNLVKQNIIAYTTTNDLQGLFTEMRGLELLKNVREGASWFNTAQKKLIVDTLLKNPSGQNFNGLDAFMNQNTLVKWEKVFKGISRLAKTRREKLISTSSALYDIRDLFNHIENALSATYEWNREDLIAYMENNTPDCEIVFDKDNVMVLNIPSFKSSRALCGKGRTAWCLTREERYFKQYVLDPRDAKQYFLFDFNKREDNELAHIGFTVRRSEGIVNAHSTSNNNMCGEGIMVDGKRVNVQAALKMCNIPLCTYMDIKKPSYGWSMESILKMFASRTEDFSLSCNKNNVLIINVLTNNGATLLLKHSFIRNSYWQVNNSTKLYVVLNLNGDYKNDDACILIRYVNDRYGSVTLDRMLDTYNSTLPNDYLEKFDIKTSDYLNRENIDPKVLLHKLINEHQEKEAIRLLEQNENMDVNHVFESNLPIFAAIEQKMFNLFESIVNHSKFDSKTTDGYGETVLHRLLYAYDTNSPANSEVNVNVQRLINMMLSSNNIDLNVQDINAETALSVAACEPQLLWVVERLVNNTKVNVNIADDFNFTPLGTAINAKNIEAIKLLGTRPDLVIRKCDVDNAKKQGFNLYDVIEPNDNSEDGLVIQEDLNELSEIFAKAFGCL